MVNSPKIPGLKVCKQLAARHIPNPSAHHQVQMGLYGHFGNISGPTNCRLGIPWRIHTTHWPPRNADVYAAGTRIGTGVAQCHWPVLTRVLLPVNWSGTMKSIKNSRMLIKCLITNPGSQLIPRFVEFCIVRLISFWEITNVGKF